MTLRILNNKTSVISGTMEYIAFKKYYDIFALFVPDYPGYYKDDNPLHLTPPLVALEKKIIERCNDTWDDSNHTLSQWDCFDALYAHIVSILILHLYYIIHTIMIYVDNRRITE